MGYVCKGCQLTLPYEVSIVSFFSGILYAFATLGPAMGYIIGGQFLDIYVDFDQIATHEYV